MLACKLFCFTGDPDKYCYETLYFCDFLGEGPDPLSPSRDPPIPRVLNPIRFIGNEHDLFIFILFIQYLKRCTLLAEIAILPSGPL